MFQKRNLLLIMLTFVLLFTFSVGCNGDKEVGEEPGEEELALEEGTYEGSSYGHNAEIEVEVTIEDEDISDIEVLSHEESEILTDPVFEEIIPAIVENNNTNVDSISGATVTSLALVSAVEDALKEAGAEEYFEGEMVEVDSASEIADSTYDVVVVGGGGAGLVSAIEAKSQGADVVLLEKMPYLGGNTLVSGGEFNAPNTWVQENPDIDDSVDQFVEDTLEGGDYEADEDLVQTLAENVTEDAEWMKDYVGVEFVDDYLMHFGGHEVPRALYPIGGSGLELISSLEERALDDEIPIKFNTEAKELLTDEDGRVVGVKVEDHEGEIANIEAEDGVIMATGGFGANIDMTQKYNPDIDDRYNTTNVPGATGEGILMAKEIGADLVDMEFIQTYPTCNTQTGHLSYVADTRFDGAILVNQEGERFVEELDRRDVISEAILDQTGSVAYLMWDNHIKENSNMDNYMTEFENLKETDQIIKADSIEEAAEFFEIDVDELKNTVEQYNEYVKQGEDEDFNRRGDLLELKEGPYYIQEVAPAIHHTMGGIKINEEAQVIDTEGEIIEGLYAAGEITGGIHGNNRLGGNAIADLIVFGRIAGDNVSK
ncbi:flavocytochrome c [Natranaerobius thermophilus]|uniref:Urocanate reductase n=1 Tax=Natranaerobius thermophilus (strain ATCC BAA-1301 / DSM 18059 / JW/NM-WN-LF) TaxID=457570 RepID=B2A190_NATTJ|nr:flavocytochrome c [Natranaerobius thermophilus]ACB86031.1 flavocytochrome c [Natranaerobius thermophilus JW/NM-WN-LF]